MLDKKNYLPAGTIAKPHGIAGEASVRLFPEMTDHDLKPSFVFIEIDNDLVPYRVSSFRYKSNDVLLVKMPLLYAEEKIRSLMGSNVYISPDDVTESPDEETPDTFAGYSVKDSKAGVIGIIQGIQDIAGNPLFIIDAPKGEILVPASDDFIININDDAKVIEMEIPEGLLDINLQE